MLTGRDPMVNRSRAAAVLFASLALAPVLAAGRPACCVKTKVAPVAAHGCCAAKPGAQASATKGCCKAPAAPTSQAKVNDGAAFALSVPQMLGAPALASLALPELVSARLARAAHHAPAPDDSPPDLLSQLHILLI